MMKLRMLLGIAAIGIGFTATAQQETGNTGKIGKMTVAAFNSVNAKANQMVSAITPTKASLSVADKALLMKVAAVGQRQLAISQAVLANVTNEQVKILANSEVEEQTGNTFCIKNFFNLPQTCSSFLKTSPGHSSS